ncbi:hypothetical protein OIE73_28620 [Streptomyces hirsutus]|uniref:DUF4145 domain-containing protein n=1 Tax=Streptomyces hirsutus TaxID=35620 RepID=A0ABZ1GUK5_9ACTN|nr:hypothetical protein [Streptomyces hirsutus]WSD09311.1 hypothetical protein OIE73_28620 [Streptomyces hirsutus]
MDNSFSFESLYKGAARAAHRAMDDHGRRDYNEFALHAGVAVELLAKAFLVSKNPIYIAETHKNANMLLYFGGDLQMAMKDVRTIGAKEAIARLRRLGVLQAHADLDTLIEMRNGAAHASSSGAEAKGMISPLARTIETLLGALGRPLDVFWGRWADALRAAVNEQQGEVHRDIQIRIAQARHAFDDRFNRLPRELKEHAISTEPHVITAAFDHIVEIDGKIFPSSIITPGGSCPSCTAQTTLLFGMVDRSADHTQYAPDGINCHVCRLSLSGFDEMAALRDILGPSHEAYDQLRTAALSTFLGSDWETD